MSLQEITKNVLSEIKPSMEQKEKLGKLSSDVLFVANREAKKYHAEAILAGSFTRNTWLPSKNEFDVFVIFPIKMDESELEEKGLEIGKKIIEELKGKWRIDYAQHPYIRGTIDDVDIDVVPCYKVESGEKIKSAVDRTPFHVEYLNKNLPEALSDHVRVLKHLLKVNGIYGADSKTEGFSGYICELLVIKYKTFENTLKNVKNWWPGEIIDIENQWEEKDYEKLRKTYKRDPLILIDPVDKNRNAAAAISPENFFKFKKIAREIIKSEDKSYFQKKKMVGLSSEEFKKILKQRGTELLVIKFNPPKVSQDILWPQLKRFTKRLENLMNDYEFSVLRSDFWCDETTLATVIIEVEVKELSKINKRVGPSVFDKDGSANFVKKYEDKCVNGPFIEDEFWCVEVERGWTTPTERLIDTLDDNLDELKAKGVPKHIAEEVSKGFEVIKGESISDLINQSKEFSAFLKGYFDKENLFRKD